MLADQSFSDGGRPAASPRPTYADGNVSFDATLSTGRRRIVVTADLIEEHALRRPMSAPELESYVVRHYGLLLRAAEALASCTSRADPVVIDRIDQIA